jgi:hypothetical protein
MKQSKKEMPRYLQTIAGFQNETARETRRISALE